jgi:hypothetical protein
MEFLTYMCMWCQTPDVAAADAVVLLLVVLCRLVPQSACPSPSGSRLASRLTWATGASVGGTTAVACSCGFVPAMSPTIAVAVQLCDLAF